MNCTGKKCIIQYDKVDPATCQCVSYCPQATPPMANVDTIIIIMQSDCLKKQTNQKSCCNGMAQKSGETQRNGTAQLS